MSLLKNVWSEVLDKIDIKQLDSKNKVLFDSYRKKWEKYKGRNRLSRRMYKKKNKLSFMYDILWT